MKVGLFMAPQWNPGDDLARGIEDTREQVRTAREHGFGSLLIGQHLVTGPAMQMLQPYPLLAALLPEAKGMQIGPGVSLLSMLAPALVAEESATLDWLSDGNFVLAAGLGYRPEEFEVMGVDKRQRVARFEEAIEVVRRLWTETTATHEGRYFQLSGVGASVRPKQQPRPPIWIGGDVEAAVRRAARIGDAWLAAPTMDIERLSTMLAVFAEERAAAELPAVRCPIIRECFIGKDTAHAKRVLGGPLFDKYASYASWGQTDAAGSGDFEAAFPEFANERFLAGDEAMVADSLQRYVELCQPDHLLLRVQWPGLSNDEAVANIERIGKLMSNIS